MCSFECTHQFCEAKILMEDVRTCDACGAVLDGQRVPGMAEVSLLQCSCGLVTTSPRPAPAELGEYYPATYYSYIPRPLTRQRKLLNKLRAYKGGYPAEDGLVSRAVWKTAASLLGDLFLFYLPYRGPGNVCWRLAAGPELTWFGRVSRDGTSMDWRSARARWKLRRSKVSTCNAQHSKKPSCLLIHSTASS